MSRNKKERSGAMASDESQLWQVLRKHIQTLDKSERAALQTLENLEAKRREYLEQYEADQDVPKNLTESQSALREMYQQLDSRYEEELQEVAKALEKVELLIGLREEISLDGSSKRKKRKTDSSISIASSASPPPVLVTPSTERFVSPIGNSRDEISIATALAPPPIEKEKKRSNSKSNGSSNTPAMPRRGTVNNSLAKEAASSIASGQGNKDNTRDSILTSSNSSSAYVDPAKARREVLAHQLPLQKGRKVAFRLPPKNKSNTGAANLSSMTSRSASSAAAASSGGITAAGLLQEEDGEQWIMATIIECINNDRNRYVVVDAEDPTGPSYNTTLKAIVPLPESLSTLPIEDYKMGMQVLGLYPDTSCFYQATVRSGGPGINGKILAKMQRKAEEMLNTPYRLEFEDDGGLIHNVPACFVVERP